MSEHQVSLSLMRENIQVTASNPQKRVVFKFLPKICQNDLVEG